MTNTNHDSNATKPIAVLKFGGEVVADESRLSGVLADVAALSAEGWRFVLCHGAGPQASELSRNLGIVTTKVGGRRVTDRATLDVMKMTLGGQVSLDVVASAIASGLRAVGISAVSDGLVRAQKRAPRVIAGGGDEPVDFGLVSDVLGVDTRLLRHLLDGGFVPVVNSLSAQVENSGVTILNINADTVASAIGAALAADHLFLMTGVPGVLRNIEDPSSRIARLGRDEAHAAIRDGVIVGGMIPKVEDAMERIAEGIGAVHILAAETGALAAEALAPGSRGTVLVP